MGGKNSGRVRYNPDERRNSISITMAPTMYAAVDASLVCGSFSMKVEHALIEWMAFKQTLVQYRDEQQKRAGTPTLLNLDAVRIYACADFQHGYSHVDTRYFEVVQRVVDSLAHSSVERKSLKWIEDTLVPALRREGLLVQVVNEVENDLFDVWVVDAVLGERGKNCGNCEVLHEVGEYIRKVQERNPS